MIDMSFDKADLITVLRMLGRLAKATIAIDAELTGQVTIASTGRIPLREAFEIVNSVLQVKGYTMVGRLGDGVLKVLPEKEAGTSGVTVATGKRPEDIPEHDTFLTQIIPLEFIDAQRIAQELKPLVAPETGSLVASSSTNHLIITDTASNVKRLVTIVSELDKNQANVMSVEVITLKFADAQSTAELLTQVFEQPRTGGMLRFDPNQGGGGGPPGGGPPGGPRGGPTPTLPGLMQAKEQLKIQADQRTNSIIASASKERLEQIKQIVEALDVNLEPDVKVQLFELQYADASTIAEEINQLLEQPQGGASSGRFQFPWSRSSDSGRSRTRVQGLTGLKENIIVADVRNNSLVATGTEENLVQIGELVAKLDVDAPLTDMMRIYPLENANAEDVENTLERVFRGGQNQSRGFFSFLFGRSGSGQSGAALDILQDISMESDEGTNSLVVTAPPQAHTLVEEMIRQLDKAKQQVFIEVAIVDVTLDDTTRLGVEWSWKTEGQPQDTIGTDFQIKNSPDFAQGMRYTVVGKELNAVLDALMEKHNVRVLSTPHVTTTDNVQATVEIGTRYPYVKSISQNATGQIPVFDWYDVTVNLQVTPRIKTSLDTSDDGDEKRADRYIQMEIQQSLAELQGQVQQLGFTQPIVGTRTANTTVSVADGQTIVIGGMIRESTNKIHKKVPFLGDLPILGSLFRSTDDKVSNTELLVFLTPHVLKNDLDIQALTDQARKRTSTLEQQGLLGKSEVKVDVGNATAGTAATSPAPAAQPQPADSPQVPEAPAKPADRKSVV
jgi:general secretion pathway protein D